MAFSLFILASSQMDDPIKSSLNTIDHFLSLDAVRPVQKKVLKPEFFVSNISLQSLDWKTIHEFYIHNPHQAFHGGRKDALRILKHLHRLGKYNDERDTPSKEGTSKASGALKFGTLSIREFYWAARGLFGPENGIIRQLVFRDMYQKIFVSST